MISIDAAVARALFCHPLERMIILSEEPDPDDLAVMHEIAEKSPVTLLIRLAFSVRTTFVPTR